MQNPLKFLYFGSSIWLLAFGLWLATAFAQQSGAIGITVAPITDEFTVNPGEVVLRTISVINPGQNVITLYPRVLNFTTDNENGQPAFFESGDESRSYTLSQWVQFDREFIRVAANEEERFDVVISAPENAEPGGHYGAVLFSTEKPSEAATEDTHVSVVGMVGTLLLATVPGEIEERLELEQFAVPKVVFGSVATLDLLFRNTGNVHVKPKGEIVVRNWSGNQTTVLNVNAGNGNVLPESRRKFSQLWDLTLKNFGLYTATAQLTYGSAPSELVEKKQFFVLPYWLILAAAAVIVGVVTIVMSIKRRRNRRLPGPVLR